MEDKTKKIFSPIAILILIVAFIGIWASVFAVPDKKLKVTYLDIGQGDSELIEFPDGKMALIDGGPGKKVLEGLGKNMPFYKRKIDIIFLSHPHADHVAGLVHVLSRYEVGRVVLTRAVHNAPEYQEFLKQAKDKNIPATEGIRGTEFDFSGGSKIKILYPTGTLDSQNLNNTSEVLMLESGKTRFLFMGDLENDGSDKLLALEPDLQTDVIKVPHHGSQNALNADLYKKASPKYAVISVGKDNKYGHPHTEVLNFLEASGIKYFRTDTAGDVSLVSDGTSVELKKGNNLLSF
ncbi:MAG: MBL fold metallo-hydrolase [bacterium]|nr:MBL fold metallo-hydrolase [bacterium]